MNFYKEEVASVLKEVDSSLTGLTSAEAASRLEKNGKNKLKQAEKDSLLKRFFAQLTDPMIIILLVAAGISALLSILALTGVVEGESEFADVIIILDDGQINGIGNHDSLLESNAIYKEIYESQTKGGKMQ